MKNTVWKPSAAQDRRKPAKEPAKNTHSAKFSRIILQEKKVPYDKKNIRCRDIKHMVSNYII